MQIHSVKTQQHARQIPAQAEHRDQQPIEVQGGDDNKVRNFGSSQTVKQRPVPILAYLLTAPGPLLGRCDPIELPAPCRRAPTRFLRIIRAHLFGNASQFKQETAGVCFTGLAPFHPSQCHRK